MGPPELLASPAGAAIAGWEQWVLHLSVPCEGMRTVQVLLDEQGQLLSASDSVMLQDLRGPEDAIVTARHETLGGRFEPDGSFRGTRWTHVSRGRRDEEHSEREATPAVPTEAEVAGLRELVGEILRRRSDRHS